MHLHKSKGLFITGTDTGVGKTHVTCLLASHLKECFRVGVMKPAESGCPEQGGRWMPQDAMKLQRAADCDLPLDLICPYALPRPLAPAEAARQAGISIDIRKIRKNYERIADVSHLVLVEGAGGLMVPLSEDYLYAELVRDLRLPLLIVARAGLGTVNHSLLTVEAALSRGIPVAVVLLNENTPMSHDPSYESNLRILRGLAPVPVIGPLPHGDAKEHEKTRIRELITELSRLVFGGQR